MHGVNSTRSYSETVIDNANNTSTVTWTDWQGTTRTQTITNWRGIATRLPHGGLCDTTYFYRTLPA